VDKEVWRRAQVKEELSETAAKVKRVREEPAALLRLYSSIKAVLRLY